MVVIASSIGGTLVHIKCEPDAKIVSCCMPILWLLVSLLHHRLQYGSIPAVLIDARKDYIAWAAQVCRTCSSLVISNGSLTLCSLFTLALVAVYISIDQATQGTGHGAAYSQRTLLVQVRAVFVRAPRRLLYQANSGAFHSKLR